MAKKFQIIGSSLVITDTLSSDILLEQPKRDSFYYYKDLRDDAVVKIYDTNGTNKTLNGPAKYPLSECVDSSDTPFTEATFLTFVRDNLGFSTTSGGSGVIDGEVEYRGDLPTTIGDPVVGSVYLVEKNTTFLGFVTYQNGLYIRQTNAGSLSDWERMNVKTNFTDTEFSIVNATDTTKKAKFDASTIATATTRTYIFPDKDGTIALLSDVGTSEDLATTLANGNTTGANNIVLSNGQFFIAPDGNAKISLDGSEARLEATDSIYYQGGTFGVSGTSYCGVNNEVAYFGMFNQTFSRTGYMAITNNDSAAFTTSNSPHFPFVAASQNTTVNQSVINSASISGVNTQLELIILLLSKLKMELLH